MIRRSALLGAAILTLAACGKADEPAATATNNTVEPTAAAVTAAVSGEQVFKRCVACHQVKAGVPSGLGPNLNGVVGRTIASVQGYTYSAGLKKKTGVWDDANLDAYIASPVKWAPGTKMAFAGIADAEQRKAVVEYLKAQK